MSHVEAQHFFYTRANYCSNFPTVWFSCTENQRRQAYRASCSTSFHRSSIGETNDKTDRTRTWLTNIPANTRATNLLYLPSFLQSNAKFIHDPLYELVNFKNKTGGRRTKKTRQFRCALRDKQSFLNAESQRRVEILNANSLIPVILNRATFYFCTCKRNEAAKVNEIKNGIATVTFVH